MDQRFGGRDKTLKTCGTGQRNRGFVTACTHAQSEQWSVGLPPLRAPGETAEKVPEMLKLIIYDAFCTQRYC
jgi:hypothetical protein